MYANASASGGPYPESGSSEGSAKVCTRASVPRAKSWPAEGPVPGTRVVIPRARRVPPSVVGSVEMRVDLEAALDLGVFLEVMGRRRSHWRRALCTC